MAARPKRDPKLVANTVTQSVLTFANLNDAEVTKDGVLHITADMIDEYLGLIEDQTINSKIAKDVFERMVAGEGTPAAIVEKHGLKQVTDTGAIEKAVDEIVAAGGCVLAQDEASSVVWGMPGSAAHSGVCSAVLPLDQIATRIARMFGGGRS